MTTFPIFVDPGHGWLVATDKQLKRAGLAPTDFSGFSYKRGNRFYLEEDCDLDLFLTAWTKKVKKPYKFKEYHGNKSSRIRNYERIK
jgi:hypothetical protein